MKMRDARGRTTGSGYGRLFSNDRLGLLFSKAQATVISNGSELERIILAKTDNIKDLELFISEIEKGRSKVYKDGVYICTKKTLKKSRYAIKGIEPDLLIFVVQRHRICKVIELKDGDAFDTKKAAAEQQNLDAFCKEFGSKVPFSTEYYVCCFNQLDKEEIYKGFKAKFAMEHIMTGQELCKLLKINYREILNMREADASDNREYFVAELLKIPEMRKMIENLNTAKRYSARSR